MYVYKGECRHCGGELVERFIGRWDEDAFPADCSDCESESLVFLDETVGDDMDEEIVR